MNKLVFTGSKIDFKGFFWGITGSPVDLISQIETHCVGLKKLKEDFPFFSKRGTVDSLILIPEEVAKNYPDVLEVKKIIQKILVSMENNYNSFLFSEVQNGVPLALAHKKGIESFLGVSEKPEFSLNKIESSTPEDSNDNAYSTEVAISLFPKSLRIELKNLILKENAVSQAFPDTDTILLNIEDHVLFQMSEAVHEYAHLIDKKNLKVRSENIEFLKSRILNDKKIKMKDFLKDQDFKKSHKDAEDLLVYPSNLLDPYAGLVYGSIEENSPSEVLSVGLQALVLNPTNFYLRDNDYFEFIKRFLNK